MSSGYEFGVGDDANIRHEGRFHQPGQVLLHVLFKILGFFVYLFAGLLTNNFVTSFVVVVACLSIDFWITKNVTGRKLVGLRWWNYVNEEGQNKWIYESRKPEEARSLSSKEANIFWSALWISQAIWIVFAFVALFSFSLKWLTLVLIANFLCGANLFGYLRCRYGKKDAQNAAMSFLAPRMMQNAWSGITSRFTRRPAAAEDYNTLTNER